MSHFSVFVIGDNVEQQLQPYHEYECTGVRDEYVTWVDVDQDYRKEYEEGSVTKYQDPHGVLHFSWDVQYHKSGLFAPRQDPTVLGYTPVEVFHRDAYKTFEAFLKEWAGIEFDDENYRMSDDGKIQTLTNPNAKWDWWVIGGRWSKHWGLDQGPRSAFDFDLLRGEAHAKAVSHYEEVTAPAAGLTPPIETWDDVLARVEKAGGNVQDAREEYNSHPWRKALTKKLFFQYTADNYMQGRDAFVRNYIARSIFPYAFVKDGLWAQRGNMGWFGMSTDETTEAEWAECVTAMLNNLSEGTQITVVDCHI